MDLLQLPKIKRNPKDTEGLCKCRPICKSRRREWKGQVQKTSAELLLERKPLPDCYRRWPSEVKPNARCPLRARTRQVTVNQKYAFKIPQEVRICSAAVDDIVDLTYLKYVKIAQQNGAWNAVRACCAFCACGQCCACARQPYHLDEESSTRTRTAMREFNARVAREPMPMRIMYDKI